MHVSLCSAAIYQCQLLFFVIKKYEQCQKECCNSHIDVSNIEYRKINQTEIKKINNKSLRYTVNTISESAGHNENGTKTKR